MFIIVFLLGVGFRVVVTNVLCLQLSYSPSLATVCIPQITHSRTEKDQSEVTLLFYRMEGRLREGKSLSKHIQPTTDWVENMNGNVFSSQTVIVYCVAIPHHELEDQDCFRFYLEDFFP